MAAFVHNILCERNSTWLFRGNPSGCDNRRDFLILFEREFTFDIPNESQIRPIYRPTNHCILFSYNFATIYNQTSPLGFH